MTEATITHTFRERARSHPDRVALRYMLSGEWRDITWRDYDRLVRRAACGLLALGLAPGDKMSILSRNRPEWHIADIACLMMGGATAPLYATSSPAQVAHIVGHSDSKIVVVEDAEQLDKLLTRRHELPLLTKAVVIEGYEGERDDFVMTWEELQRAGSEVPADRVDAALDGLGADDLATLVYTSGTTGPPKAVMLTHGNIMWTAAAAATHLSIAQAQGARTLSYLPLSHIAERMISHLLQIYNGSTTWFAESMDTVAQDLQACKPTYFFAVPRVWEKLHSKFQSVLAEAGPGHRKVRLAHKAIALGRRVTQAEQEAVLAGRRTADARVAPVLKLQHRLYDALVLAKIRSAMGLDACELALSASAPINPELVWFFHSIGVKIAEGYGQSEDCGPTTWNPPDAIKIGSVGPALPGLELRIADDGEVMAHGGNVTPGYYKDEEATAELFDDEGFMHSGDIGELDHNGYLNITDRKKDLIITAGGKNVAPQEIENKIKFHDLVSQVVVIGDGLPFLTALVTLDEEKAPQWAREQGIEGGLPAIADSEMMLEHVHAHITEVNDSLARVEGVRKFRVLTRDFLQEENEITPSLKVKRKRINEVYGTVIEEMYDKNSPAASSAAAPERK